MTMAKNIRCATILLILALGITSSIKDMASEDLQVLVSDSSVISCFPNRVLSVQWHHTPLGKSSSAYVYAGGRFYFPYNTGRFRVDNNSTTNIYTLVITNVTPEDVGLYECKDDVMSGVFGSTQLIVLNSRPVCNSNMHPDGFIGPNKCDLQKEYMTFSCAVSFSGKTSPSLMWRSFNDNQSLINSVCNIQPNHINCSVTLKADPGYDGTVFICETKASIGPRFNCSTEIVKVQYFSADSETYARKVRDNVSCIVRNSNLETRYNWKTEQNGQYVYLSSNRTIVMKKPGIYRCDVEYSIRDNTCSFLASVVSASVDSSNEEVVTGSSDFQEEQGVKLVAILLPIALILIILIVVCIIIVRHIRKRKRDRQDNGQGTSKPLRNSETIANRAFLFSIETKASLESKYPIYGLAILGNEIFTISRLGPEFEVYNYTGSRLENLRLKRCCPVDSLKDPKNIVACSAKDCLYIENKKNADNKLNEIIRVNKDGTVLDRWGIDEAIGRISITTESNVLVTVRSKSSLREYTPEGKVHHEIEIDKEANIKNLRHALFLDADHYVLCHGDEKDAVKRVCIVDKKGKVLAKFGDEVKLTNPQYLAVHPSGSILVVDDKRIIMLNRQLRFEDVLLKDKKSMHCTFRVCFDSERHHLLVTDNKYVGLRRARGRVLVYNYSVLSESNQLTNTNRDEMEDD